MLDLKLNTIDFPDGKMQLSVDSFVLPADTLFTVAARNNPKRSFLFLSKVLGKHLPVDPFYMEYIHQQLAQQIPKLPEPIIFIGMAETATCLGQGVFEAWKKNHPNNNASYFHTTRYKVENKQPIFFEESHSHAPNIWLYQSEDNTIAENFRDAKSIVLIDDELSTGNTFINLVNALRPYMQGLSHTHWVSITDFLGETIRQQLPSRIHLPITFSSLLQGHWTFEKNASNSIKNTINNAQSNTENTPYIRDPGLGRLGRSECVELSPECLQMLAHKILPEHRVLVLGTGEFMHPAFVLARELKRLTHANVVMHATTRSPILNWGGITQQIAFNDNYQEGVLNYIYNYQRENYDVVFICYETANNLEIQQLTQLLKARAIQFKSESDFEEITFC